MLEASSPFSVHQVAAGIVQHKGPNHISAPCRRMVEALISGGYLVRLDPQQSRSRLVVADSLSLQTLLRKSKRSAEILAAFVEGPAEPVDESAEPDDATPDPDPDDATPDPDPDDEPPPDQVWQGSSAAVPGPQRAQLESDILQTFEELLNDL
jgi:hypothetical protein